MYINNNIIRKRLGKPQKNNFLVARPLRGGGVKAWPLRKNTVFEALRKIRGKNLWPLSSRREGDKALVAGQLTKIPFFAASLTI